MSGRQARAARRAAAAETKKPPRVQSPARRGPTGRRIGLGIWALVGVPVVVVGLYALTALGKQGGGDYPYVVGTPGPGTTPPPFALPSTAGGTFEIAAYKGKAQVLLFFHEGLTCQPCWDQLKTIQQDRAKFRALGIGPIVGVTTDPIDLVRQKVQDEGIRIPVLSDTGAELSTVLGTNRYQMMGMGERNGHTFILVGKDGRIRWRADYGGEPKFTMFVPDDALLADLRQGIGS